MCFELFMRCDVSDQLSSECLRRSDSLLLTARREREQGGLS